MRNKLILAASILLFLPFTIRAQWSAGLLAGADYNIHSQDTHYMTDYRFRGFCNEGCESQACMLETIDFFPKIGLTARMLMSHTACIWCDKFNPRPEATKALNLETNKKHKEYFYTDKPGTAYHYSNYGAGILGCMIEAITGERLDDAVSELIFDRMGLDAGYSPDYLKVPGNITSEVIREYGEGIDLDNDYVFSYGNCQL